MHIVITHRDIFRPVVRKINDDKNPMILIKKNTHMVSMGFFWPHITVLTSEILMG